MYHLIIKIKKQLVASLFFVVLFAFQYSIARENHSLTEFPHIIRTSIDTLCNQENTAYVVIFNIEQGDVNSYAVSASGTLIGDQFISDFIPSGNPFIFIVTDANQCGADTIAGAYSCDCQSSVGHVSELELNYCSNDTLRSTDFYDPAGQVILGNDTRNYILSTSEINPISDIIQSNSLGIFMFDEASMNYGRPYFVIAVVGRRIGVDSVDLADACLQISERLSVTWFDEIDDISIAYSGLEITCDDPTIRLVLSTEQDTTGYIIQWNAENGGAVGVNDSLNHQLFVTEAGSYHVTVHHPLASCETMVSIDITESSELPRAVIAQPEVLTCDLIEITLSGLGSTSNQNIIYEWLGPGIVGVNNELELLINEAGIYYLTVNDTLNDCVVTESIVVLENITPPSVEVISAEKIDCETDIVNISGQGSSVGLNFVYQWEVLLDSGNIISPNTQRDIQADAPGLYQLLVTNVTNGCSASDSAWVEYDENFIRGAELLITQPACSGAFDGMIDIVEIFGGREPFRYSFDGGVSETSISTMSNLAPGIYPILIQDSKGCSYADTVVLTAPFDFLVDLGEDQTLGQGATVAIEAQTDLPDSLIKSIKWSPVFDSINSQNLTQSFNPDLGFYTISIQLENNNGCIETDEMVVIIKFEKRIFIPNALHPESMKQDNRFINIYSDTSSVAGIPRFDIYDRWGGRVFQRFNVPVSLTLNPDFAWNGTKRGEVLNPGVYVYRVEINYVNGKREVKTGEITLAK